MPKESCDLSRLATKPVPSRQLMALRSPPGVPLAASEKVGHVTQAVIAYGLVEFDLPLSQLRTHSQGRKTHAFRLPCTHQSVPRPCMIKAQTATPSGTVLLQLNRARSDRRCHTKTRGRTWEPACAEVQIFNPEEQFAERVQTSAVDRRTFSPSFSSLPRCLHRG